MSHLPRCRSELRRSLRCGALRVSGRRSGERWNSRGRSCACSRITDGTLRGCGRSITGLDGRADDEEGACGVAFARREPESGLKVRWGGAVRVPAVGCDTVACGRSRRVGLDAVPGLGCGTSMRRNSCGACRLRDSGGTPALSARRGPGARGSAEGRGMRASGGLPEFCAARVPGRGRRKASIEAVFKALGSRRWAKL
jgi:hypothetical protein